MADNAPTSLPTPDPAFRRLERFVGTWNMRGRLLGSTGDNVTGEATFRWLPGGFFLEQTVSLNVNGLEIESLELIGYDAETDTFPSTVYANVSPMPLPYRWSVDEQALTISVSYGPLDATFEGRFSDDGDAFAGGWRPNPGADESVNISYDIEGRRVG